MKELTRGVVGSDCVWTLFDCSVFYVHPIQRLSRLRRFSFRRFLTAMGATSAQGSARLLALRSTCFLARRAMHLLYPLFLHVMVVRALTTFVFGSGLPCCIPPPWFSHRLIFVREYSILPSCIQDRYHRPPITGRHLEPSSLCCFPFLGLDILSDTDLPVSFSSLLPLRQIVFWHNSFGFRLASNSSQCGRGLLWSAASSIHSRYSPDGFNTVVISCRSSGRASVVVSP